MFGGWKEGGRVDVGRLEGERKGECWEVGRREEGLMLGGWNKREEGLILGGWKERGKVDVERLEGVR